MERKSLERMRASHADQRDEESFELCQQELNEQVEAASEA
jgi:hypothetical protein